MKTKVLLDSNKFDEFLEKASMADYVAIDTEAVSDIRDSRGYCMGVSLAFPFRDELSRSIYSTYMPFRHSLGDVYGKDSLAKLKEVIENANLVIFHNAKFDIVSLGTLGIHYENNFYDTMLMAHMINENWMSKALDWLTINVLGEPGKLREPALEDFIKKFGWEDIPSFLMYEYSEHDAKMTLNLFETLYPMFVKQGFDGELWNIEQDWVRLLIKIESHGIRIDQHLAKKEYDRGIARMADIVEELGGINPASRLDLERLLILELGLPVMEYTPQNRVSFSKKAMDAYELLLSDLGDNPTARLVLEFRGYQKTVGSNYHAYLELLSPDGRLRPNFKIHGTVTGRLSCEKPNLQQIPRISDKPWNGRLKEVFIPASGCQLWELDYKNLELRLAAAYAKQENLLSILNNPEADVFTEMSQQLGLTRYETKTLSYMILYMAGNDKISQRFGVPYQRAKNMREHFLKIYPGFMKMTNMATGAARQNGYVKYWTARRRHFEDRDKVYMAFNAVIQGGAFEIVKRRMLAVNAAFPDVPMILQVHDSVVLEIPTGLEDTILPQVVSIMEDVGDEFGVKFYVDVHRWGTEVQWQPKKDVSTNSSQVNAPFV